MRSVIFAFTACILLPHFLPAQPKITRLNIHGLRESLKPNCTPQNIANEFSHYIAPVEIADSSRGQLILPVSSADILRTRLSSVSSARFSFDDQFLLFYKYVVNTYTATLWDFNKGQVSAVFDNVLSADFCKTNNRLIVHAQDRSFIYAPSTQTEIFTLKNPGIWKYEIIAEGRFILFHSEGQNQTDTVYLYSAEENKIIQTFPFRIFHAQISEDENLLAIYQTPKRQIRVLDIKKQFNTVASYATVLPVFEFIPNSRRLIYLDVTGVIATEPEKKKKLYHIPLNSHYWNSGIDMPASILFSPSGETLIITPKKNTDIRPDTVRFYEVNTGKKITGIPGTSIEFQSQNGKYFILQGEVSRDLYAFNGLKKILSARKYESIGLGTDPDHLIITTDHSVSVLDLEKSEEILKPGRALGINTLSHNGKWLVYLYDAVAQIYEVNGGKMVYSAYYSEKNWLTFDAKGNYDCSEIWSNQIFFQCNEYSSGETNRVFSNPSLRVRDLAEKILKNEPYSAPVISYCSASGYRLRNFRAPDITDLPQSTATYRIGSKNKISLDQFSGNELQVHTVEIKHIFEIWDMELGKLLFTMYFDKLNHFIAISPQGYYDKQPEFIGKVGYKINGGIFESEQFFETYYRPDIIRGLAAGDSFGRASYSDLSTGIKNPPAVSLKINYTTGLRSGNNLVFAHKSIPVTLSARNNGGGIHGLRLYKNDKLIWEKNAIEGIQNDTISYTIFVAPEAGKNKLRVVGISDDYTESLPATEIFTAENNEPDATLPDLYVLGIGIDKYRNSKYDLNYCKADVKGFTDSLKTVSKNLFHQIKIFTYFDFDANRESISQFFKQYSDSVKPGDMFICYYAGHGICLEGSAENKSEFYYVLNGVTQMTDSGNCSKNGISGTEMKRYLTAVKANKQILFVDACNSGAFVDQFIQRGAAEENALARLSRATGSAVFASTTKEQSAQETTSLGHGLFSYIILKALSGEAASGNCMIMLSGLKGYIDEQTPVYTQKIKGNTQYPTTFMYGQDFPLGIRCKQK